MDDSGRSKFAKKDLSHKCRLSAGWKFVLNVVKELEL